MKRNYHVIKMMLVLLLASPAWLAGKAYSQPKAAGEPIALISSEAVNYLHPKWSPDGSTLAFSSDNFDGIWLADADGRNMRLLNTDSGIGFGFAWSPGGDLILGRSSQFINKRRYQDIKVIDVKSGETEILVEKTRGINTLPAWSQDGSHIALAISRETEFLTSEKLRQRALPGKSGDAVFAEHGKLYLAQPEARSETLITEFEGRNIFGLSVSPDGQKAAFQVGGMGLYLVNTDGSGLKQLGHAEQATWTLDGKYLIATIIEDDGYLITGGQLVAINVETGEQHQLLPNSTIIALRPDVSPCGHWVLFENPQDGNIYKLQVVM